MTDFNFINLFHGVSMKKLFTVLFLMSFLIGCGPSVNPLLQKKINDITTKSSGGSFKMAGKFMKPMPWAVGQWVMTVTTNADGVKSLSKTSLIEKSGDNWTIETWSLTESKEDMMQMVIGGMEKMQESGNPDDMEIISIKVKDENGNISNIDGVVLSMTKGFYKKMLPNMNVKVEGGIDGGAVTVPAGSFAGTWKVNAEVSFLGSKFVSDSYFHPDVPINGMVKSVADEKKITTELHSFGLSGAKSNF